MLGNIYHEFCFSSALSLVVLCEVPLRFAHSVLPVFSKGEPLNKRHYTAFKTPPTPQACSTGVDPPLGRLPFPGVHQCSCN